MKAYYYGSLGNFRSPIFLAGYFVIVVLAGTLYSSYSSETHIPFDEVLVLGDLSYPYGLSVSDLDRDGDLDLTVSDAWPGAEDSVGPSEARLFAIENLGEEKLSASKVASIAHDPLYKGVLLERQVVADIDGDRFPDVVNVWLDAGRVVAFRNPGAEQFSRPWQRILLSEATSTVVGIGEADLDGDGWTDIAVSGRDGRYGWLRGNAAVTEGWPYKQIKLADSKLRDARTAYPADLDNDGDIDILGTFMNRPAESGGVLIFENIQSGAEWVQHEVFESTSEIYQSVAADIDKDGRLEILVPQGNSIVILYNDDPVSLGTGKWRAERIETPDAGSGSWFELFAADVDGDHDVDMVATRWSATEEVGAGGVYWFEARGEKWQMHALKETWPRANGVVVADLNGDGRVDIAAIAEGNDRELRVWYNRMKEDQ